MEKGLLDGVRWVLFDAVGTLIDAEPPVAEIYFAAARDFGSSLSRGEIQERFAGAMRVEQDANLTTLDRMPTNEALERERWRRIVASVVDDAANSQALFERLWHHFAQPASWRVDGDVGTALGELRERGLRLGIASNFDSRLHRVLSGHAVLAPVERVFVSSEVGFVKPDPRFFGAVQERLGAAPAEILLVGDDEVNDMAGATAAGWKGILLDRSRGGSVPGGIGSLTDIY